MKIFIDKNGWTIHITELDPRKISIDEIELLRILPYTNVLVVIHDVPKLSSTEYQTFAHKIFDKIQNDNPNPDIRFIENTNREVMQVTGRKNSQGEISGLFGMPELLDWHNNQPHMPMDRRPDCLMLYSVEGSEGSITAYSNSILALNDLRNLKDAPLVLIKTLDNIEVHYEYKSDAKYEYVGRNKLVNKNKSGQECILLGNIQVDSFYLLGRKIPDHQYDAWSSFLKKFLIQEKYVYEHNWKNNQITLNCQVASQHSRYPFEGIEKRLLWRIMGHTKSFDKPLQTNFPSWN